MVLSRVVNSKVLRVAIQFEVCGGCECVCVCLFLFLFFFFLIERQNGECNVRNFRRFLFGMSHDVLAFKAPVSTSDFKF